MNKVAEHFDHVSPNYTKYFLDKKTGINFCLRKRLELASELAAGSSGRLLDCASGTGEITCALLKSGRFHSATINDISPAMQKHARELIGAEVHGVATRFVQSDIFEFTQPGDKFDFIMCLGLIAHVGRIDDLLSKLKSMLAPGGRILLQTTLANHPNTLVWRALTSRIYAKRFGYRISYFNHADIIRACAEAGLGIGEMRRYTVGVPLLHLFWDWGSYQVEARMQKWAAKHGSEAIYLLETK